MPFPTEPPAEDLRTILWRLNERLLNAARPDDLERSLAELDGVSRTLQTLPVPPTPEVAAELKGLQADLSRAARLVESGLDLQTKWAHVLGAAVGGYTAEGDAAPLESPRHVSVQG